MRGTTRMLGRPHSLILRKSLSGEVTAGSDFCAPRRGRYTVLINGSLAELEVERGTMTIHGPVLDGQVEVEFLDRLA